MNTIKFILVCILAAFIANNASAQSIADKIEEQDSIFRAGKESIVKEKNKQEKASLFDRIENVKDSIVALYKDSIKDILETNKSLIGQLSAKQNDLDSLAVDKWLNIDDPSVFIPVKDIPQGKIHKSREGYYTLITKICALKELLSHIEENIIIKKQYDEDKKALTKSESENLFESINKNSEDAKKRIDEINSTNEIFKNSLSTENREYYRTLIDKYFELQETAEKLTK